MKIIKKVIDTIVMLDITGVVKLGESAKQVTSELSAILDNHSYKGVIINMENIDYMDSTGLGELVGYLNRFKEAGKPMRIVKPNKVVMRLMELTKLNEVMPIYPSEEKALENFYE